MPVPNCAELSPGGAQPDKQTGLYTVLAPLPAWHNHGHCVAIHQTLRPAAPFRVVHTVEGASLNECLQMPTTLQLSNVLTEKGVTLATERL